MQISGVFYKHNIGCLLWHQSISFYTILPLNQPMREGCHLISLGFFHFSFFVWLVIWLPSDPCGRLAKKNNKRLKIRIFLSLFLLLSNHLFEITKKSEEGKHIFPFKNPFSGKMSIVTNYF